MTSVERIDGLRTAAGSDAQAIAECLELCRDTEIGALDLDAWARSAVAGDYLAEYWDGERDPGSRCGLTNPVLADVNSRLGKRSLRLAADDRGLRVVSTEEASDLTDRERQDDADERAEARQP